MIFIIKKNCNLNNKLELQKKNIKSCQINALYKQKIYKSRDDFMIIYLRILNIIHWIISLSLCNPFIITIMKNIILRIFIILLKLLSILSIFFTHFIIVLCFIPLLAIFLTELITIFLNIYDTLQVYSLSQQLSQPYHRH